MLCLVALLLQVHSAAAFGEQIRDIIGMEDVELLRVGFKVKRLVLQRYIKREVIELYSSLKHSPSVKNCLSG